MIFLFYPPWVKFNDELKIDLFINILSFVIIKPAEVKKYFNFIHKYISDDGFFLNANDYVYPKIPHNNFCDLPYDNDWEVKLSKKFFKKPHIHVLLTQRKFSNFKNNIKNEMEKIKIESKKYQTNTTPLVQIRRRLKAIMVNNFWKIFKFLFKKKFLKKLGYKILSLE